MLEAVIFDMDGVIVDTEPGYLKAINMFLGEYGKSITKEENGRYIGTSNSEMWSNVKKLVGLDNLTVEECITGMEQKRRELINEEGYHPIEGTIELIQSLHGAGIPLAVASSSSREEIARVTKTLNVRKYFKDYVSGIDECERSKPFPEVFLKAANKLNVKPEHCLVIEDASNGVIAAKRAGMYAIGFRNPKFGCQKLEGADLVVTSMKNVDVELCKKVSE